LFLLYEKLREKFEEFQFIHVKNGLLFKNQKPKVKTKCKKRIAPVARSDFGVYRMNYEIKFITAT